MPSPEYECGKRNPLYPIRASVVEKIYGMAYIFTLLMFRKPNKTTINKKKRQFFIGQRLFDSSLYLDISRSFKCPKSSPVVFDLLLLAVGSLVVFVLREYILKVHILVSSEHKLCQI